MSVIIYDTLIIGSGPAGMIAAIYAARREMKALVLGRELGGQVIWASEIENVPAYKTITNIEFIQKMSEQVKCQGVEIKTEDVKRLVKLADDNFEVTTASGTYLARTVILALGLMPKRLAIPGEEALTGRGVSYCANCDGPFFRNKTIAVIGGGNAALDAAEVMSKIAAKVFLLHRSEKYAAFDALVGEVSKRENVEMRTLTETLEIVGENKVTGVRVRDKRDGKEELIELDGVFVEVGRIAHTDTVADLVDRDEKAQILVNEKCQTKTPGLFAAGDVTQVPFKQITVACGQGTIAALAAYEYLQLKGGGSANKIADKGHSGTRVC
jgi:NADH-dependent peroxiredoxin subunit F